MKKTLPHSGVVLAAVVVLLASTASPARAVLILAGGQTNVRLDPTILSTAGLTISSFSPEVIVPGLWADSVAFPINSPSDAPPTTLAFNPATFPGAGSFSGVVEHSGSVVFNGGALEAGNFTIGFDAARTGTLGGLASGFYVQNNIGVSAILFDLELTSATAPPGELKVEGNLLLSPEFGQILVNLGLTMNNLRGLVVGEGRLRGNVVPEPATIALALGGLAMVALARKRR